MFGDIARRLIMSGLLVLAPIGSAAAQAPTQSQLLVPNDVQLAIMIKTSLIAFNHANLTGNYAVLRDLAAPSFREANSQARLAEIFQKPRKAKLNIGPIVLLQPKLVRKPWINKRNLLRLQGFFATRPQQVNFNLAFAAVGNQWRLFAIGVTASKPKVAGKTPAGKPPAKAKPAKAKPVKKTPAAGRQGAREPGPAAPKPRRAAAKQPAAAPAKKPATAAQASPSQPASGTPKVSQPEPPKKKKKSWWSFGN